MISPRNLSCFTSMLDWQAQQTPSPTLLQSVVVSGLPQRSCFGGATGSPEPPVWGHVGTCLTYILSDKKHKDRFLYWESEWYSLEVLWLCNSWNISGNWIWVHWVYFNSVEFTTNLLAAAHSTMSEAFSHPMLSPEHINGTCMRMLYGHLFWYAKGFLVTCWKCSHRGVLLGSSLGLK